MTDLSVTHAPRRRTRDDARAEKRRHILDAAAAVFQRLGYEGASMNDIVAEARVSKPTLYVYFQNKEGLFAALVEDLKERQPEGAIELDPETSDPGRAMRDFGYALIRKMTGADHIAVIRMVIAAADKFPEIGRILYEAGPCRGLDMVTRFLTRQVELGHMAIDDVEMAAWQYIDLMHTPHIRRMLFNVSQRPSQDEVRRSVDSGVALFLAAHRPKPVS